MKSLTALTLMFVLVHSTFGAPSPDERPAAPEEWGFRPLDKQASEMNPPGFVWRPQKEMVSYDFECASDEGFKSVVAKAVGIKYACYCPDKALAPGTYYWRFRFTSKKGEISNWSTARSFTLSKGAVVFPMPAREELLSRIPDKHPRLFVRPEQMDDLRKRAQSEMKADYDAIAAMCEKLLENPPPTAEPPKYPPGMTTKSEEWRVIWWGNREYTIKVLDAAATLGFAYQLSGNQKYGELGRRLLMEAAQWDPKGSTNYHYNDEAGMPYVYFFARAYTFLNPLLSDADKSKCREVIRVRGEEMYKHLNPRHLWSPYASHSNRAWHKLAEAGIAFADEIPEAKEWVWFAMNVFFNVYPVWCDDDGGWHEGVSYWNSYIERFTFFADIMKADLGIDAFRKPYFSRIGYYPMYLQPPGTPGGGFGDLVPERKADANARLMTALAAQANNPHWAWYAAQIGGPVKQGGYIGFVRGATAYPAPKSPDDLPASRLFRGIGQAYLNTNLKDARQNVELGFKSSPFGTQSHGYDSNNTFFLYAFGERLLAPTGRRDIYGSKHHVNWMWETKSTNGITVNGQGQGRRTAKAVGKITAFHTSEWLDYVAGDASNAYGADVKKAVRQVVFLKPQTIVIVDQIAAVKPSTFEYWLHAPTEMKIDGQESIQVTSGKAQCRVSLLAPAKLELNQTDQYDPPPAPRIKVKEWHLSAKTVPASEMEFVTVIRVGRETAELAGNAVVRQQGKVMSVALDLPGGKATVTRLEDGKVEVVRTDNRGAAKRERVGEGE